MSLPAGEGGDGRGGAITSWAGATAGSSRAAACTQGRVASLQGSNAKRRQIYPPAASDLHAPSLFLSASVRLPCRRRLPCGPPPLPLCRRSAAAQGVCHMPLQRVCGGTPAPGTQHGAKAEQLHQGARVRDGGGPHCVARGPDEQEVNDRLNAVDCERFSSSLAGSAHGCCTPCVCGPPLRTARNPSFASFSILRATQDQQGVYRTRLGPPGTTSRDIAMHAERA
mgnify:CR=1 FL=1